MTETAIPPVAVTATPAAAPAATPGYKTTEFWLAVAAKLLGILFASGVLADGSTVTRIAGLAATVLASLGYSVSRGMAKAPVARAAQAGFARISLMTALVVLGVLAIGCGWWSSSGKSAAKTGGAAVAACAIGDLTKYASGVEQALAQDNYGAALAQFKTANQLTDDALTCLIQGVIAVLAQPGLLTGQESPVVLHGKAYLAAHGAK